MAKSPDILVLLKSMRQNISCRFDLLQYIAERISKECSKYDYIVTRESIKRIDKDGNIEIVLQTPTHRVKANYFYELGVFIKQEFYNLYENIEEYYEKNGYEHVTPLTPRQLIREQLKNCDNLALLDWLNKTQK